ncbi:MAG: phosphotransferase [bacterium]|nr:phosphotransferase [bacterium]
MHPFSCCSYSAQVARLRKLAYCALSRYAIQARSVRLIRHWNNTTFDVRDGQGRRYVLRISRPGFQDLSQVQSEMTWLAAIQEQTDLIVPDAVLTLTGEQVIEVATEGVPEARVCVVFHRKEGVFYGRGLRTAHYEAAGQLMARLHELSQVSASTAALHRKMWTVETAIGCVPAIDQNAFKALLRPTEERVYQKVWDRYAEVYHTLGLHTDVYGMIHGDFHPGNILFFPSGVGAIDFDECGWGHYLHDVAVALMGIRNRPDAMNLRCALLRGYCSVRELPEVLDGALNALIAGRLLGLAVWTAGVTDHPWNRAHAPRVVAETMDELRELIRQ